MPNADKNFDTLIKNTIRTQLFRVIRQIFRVAKKKTKVVHNALMMPARECLCVKEALKVGVFTKNTNIVAIESDEKSAEIIDKELQRLGFKNYKVIRQNLQDITADDLKRRLCKPSKGLGRGFKCLNNTKTNFDFVYLDLMGTPCAKTEKWLTSTLTQVIAWSTTVAMTYINSDRTNNTLGRFPPSLQKDPHKFSNNWLTNYNAKKIASMTINAFSPVGKNRIVKYGRCYTNSNSAMPMVTFITGYGLKQKRETHKSFAYDLGYV